MNSLERYTNCIKGKPIDYLPRIPIVMQFAAEYIGSNYASFASKHKTLVRANIRCAKDFSFDQLSAISDPYRETHGFGADIECPFNQVPKCINPPLENSLDLSLLKKPNSYKSERMADRIQAIQLYSKEYKNDYSIMGWIEGPAAESSTLRTVNNFFVDLLLNSSFACELMDICTEVSINFAKAQIESGADTIGIGDAVASQVSPQVYEKMIQPREKRVIQAIHRMGAFVRLHICGNISHLLEGIADLGVDILDVDHMVSMKEVRKQMREGTVLSGNIDPVEGILRGSPAKIREYILNTYEEVGNPFMINAGCEIPSGTPNENVHALCESIDYQE